MAKAKLVFEEKVWKIYKVDEYKTGGSELRIESWVVNRKGWPARLTRRDYFVTGEKGDRKTGKAKGLTMEDVSFVESNGIEICNEMAKVNDEIKRLNEENAPPKETAPAENWNT